MAAQQARIAELEKAQRELPRQIVASATKGSPVDSPLARARSELAAARASLSERHPTVQALKQRVASLQAQRKGQPVEVGEQTLAVNPARTSVDQQLATARAALAAARERESALRVLLKATTAEAWSLAPEEGEARQIVGALEAANARVDELSARAATLRDAALGPVTGFACCRRRCCPRSRSPRPSTSCARDAADLDGADPCVGVHRAPAPVPDGRSATGGCMVGKRSGAGHECLAP